MTSPAAPEAQSPIVNSPFAEPRRHWDVRAHKPAVLVEERRKATYFYLPPGAKPEQGDKTGYRVELHKVSLIRERLAKWRELALKGGGGVSRVTAELLHYWRREGRLQPLFFAQLEAAETIIFLTEARADFLHGVDIPVDEPGEAKIRGGFSAFRRRCCRMATGAGKTTVMAMLAAWSILNKTANRGDKRFSDSVLAVCPNVTIRTRLAELNPQLGEASIYRTRDLVPPAMMNDLRRGRVHIVNWHVFEPQSSSPGASRVVKTGRRVTVRETVRIGEKNATARGRRYITEKDLQKQKALGLLVVRKEIRGKDGALQKAEIESEKHIETDGAVVRRVLQKALGGAQNILVFNDEAHHAYRLQDGADDDDFFDDDERAESYYKEATVWVDGLDKIHKLRGINFCADFSATPYFLGGRAGGLKNRIFPWTVSSFGLEDAIEAGVVKVPQLAARDSTGAVVPGYFNIWKWVTEQLSPSERGGKKSEAKPEAILKYAHTPLEMLGGEWEKTLRESEKSEDKRPPVFIVVCKTTKLAKIVYEWLAEGKPPSPAVPQAQLPSLRNSETETNTVRIDNAVQDEIESGYAKSDETKWMRHTLDTVGKTDWHCDRRGAPIYPEGFEELAEKLGRPKHPPGRDLRCIVSVGMLTEDWDCSTVTHIIGLRPFMSQLLCEQVVGRGLRRRHYEPDANGMLPEEVASVFGVPLAAFPVKGGEKPPPPPRERHHICALPERGDLKITFPRVEGYLSPGGGRIVCDIDSFPPLEINPEKIPPEVELKAGVSDNRGRPSLAGPGKLGEVGLDKFRGGFRFQERVFEMAEDLMPQYIGVGSRPKMPENVLFSQLCAAVAEVLRKKVTAHSPANAKDAFLSPYYGWIVENMRECIKMTDENASAELPLLERSRGEGTTADVDFWTVREPCTVLKSHVNAVVPASKLEQRAAQRLDRHPKVRAFVKNEGLGFGIPYFHDGETREYIPDFIVALETGERLIWETKGYDPLQEIKRCAAERWVAAVNAGGKHGKWRYLMTKSAGDINSVIGAK